MTRSRYRIFNTECPYFLTCTVVGWLPVFTHPQFVERVYDSWRFLRQERGVEIYGYVILENHLHWIASCDKLSEQVGRFKSYTARRIIDDLQEHGYDGLLDQLTSLKPAHRSGQAHQLWQEGSHPEEIQSHEMMVQKLEYMHNNPVRRGYVDDPLDWRYSSARNYEGAPGLIDVLTDWQ